MPSGMKTTRRASKVDQGRFGERVQMESTRLRRASSLGSTRTDRQKSHHQSMSSLSSPGPSRGKDRARAFRQSSIDTAESDWPVPSGPSTPQSTSRFTASAPGRILSGLSETCTEAEDHTVSDERQKETFWGRTGALIDTGEETRPDSSPTLPAFQHHPNTIDCSEVIVHYCPLTPDLTPSPHLSLCESPDLTTPHAPKPRGGPSCAQTDESSSTDPPLDYPHSPLFSPQHSQGNTSALDRESIRSSSPDVAKHAESSMSFNQLHRGGGDTWSFSKGAPGLDRLPLIPRTGPPRPTPSPQPHPFQHNYIPSVPSSTRTNSVSSVTRSDPLTPSDSIYSPPSSFNHLKPPLKRYSKLTALSGSSESSNSSSESSSPRAFPHHWHLGERPDISTVFEEENSVDVELEEVRKGDRRSELAQGPPRHPIPPNHPHNTPIPFSPTIDRGTTERSERFATVSYGRSRRTSKLVHPFASPSLRSASPPPFPSSQSLNTFHKYQQPERPSHRLAGSNSQTNLADSYRMPAPVFGPAHQVALVSAEDKNDDELCPVCVESLSFTFRLPGEKPHVVPECGHALHEVSLRPSPVLEGSTMLKSNQECFVTVYGEVPPEGSRRNLGVCGVCRQPMRLAESSERKGRGGNSQSSLPLTRRD